MKNYKILLASMALVLYALMAGASIDSNGDFEGWFIALLIIVPLVAIIGLMIYYSFKSQEKDNARQKVPSTYRLDVSGEDSELYVDTINHMILVIAYGASGHDIHEISGVDKTNIFNYGKHYLVIDDLHQKVHHILATSSGIKSKTIDYISVIGIDISENGNSVFQKSTSSTLVRALVGGVLLGGVGAVLGGITGKSKEKKTIDSYKITIQINDVANPTYEMELLDIPIELDDLGSMLYKSVQSYANKVKAAMLAIIKANEIKLNLTQAQAAAVLNAQAQQQMLESNGFQAIEQGTTQSSIADELIKLSELHKTGVLTDEEFEEQKKKLLNK